MHVTGWILEDTGNAAVDANAPGLTDIAVAALMLHPDGAGVSGTTDAMRRLIRRAHHDGLRAEVVLSNYSNRLGDFDPLALHRLLSHPARITAVARSVAAQVRRNGWDGVNVDLERVRRSDGPGLVSLLAALQRLMPDARTVSVDLSPGPTVADYVDSGYRLRGIARYADVVDLMGYDYSGPGWTGPGPIGPLPWQRRVTRAALQVVPRSKVQLGVAGYGYAWTSPTRGYTVSPRQARAKVAADGATAHWRATPGEVDRHVVGRHGPVVVRRTLLPAPGGPRRRPRPPRRRGVAAGLGRPASGIGPIPDNRDSVSHLSLDTGSTGR
ncbi:hypothetical protein GCM10028772_39970 [Nocardioides ultimimeridianus]